MRYQDTKSNVQHRANGGSAFARISLVLATAAIASAPLAMGLTGMSGCAEPEEINRVQPDLIKKSDLAGEWYSLGTVVRAPFASHFVFPGLQGTLERGIWEVQRADLVFYRTYEAVEGSDAQGIRSDIDTPLLDADGKPVTYDKTLPDGTVVKATRYVYRAAPIKKFAIAGHYDVRRQYNPLTGEESNVIVEDAGEKFWYQRDYMRVDFGSNGATNFADMAFGDALPANLSVYEGEEAPDDLKLRVDAGKYMDFVVRGLVLAPTEYFEGYGYVPTCLFTPWYTGAYYECDEEEIHIRTSFMRVQDNNTYKPLDWNDHMLNKFGYYRSARSDYDQNYGETFTGADRFIRRFRIWKDYATTSEGALDYAKMEPNTIVYYLSKDFPRELVRGAKALADQWNKPFSEVVKERKDKNFAGRMFVLCENSQAEADAAKAADANALVAETDPNICKDMGAPKYLGDLRYNILSSVNEPVQYGLYGYGPMHSDPITGETIHANAFQYTGNLRLGARNAVDMIEYTAGVQNFRDITQARNIETSLRARRLAGTQGAPKLTSGEAALSGYVAEAANVVGADIAAAMDTTGFQKTDLDIAAARMNRLTGSDEYSYLWLNEDMAAMVGMPLTQLGKVTGPNARVLSDMVSPAALGTEKMLGWKMNQDIKNGVQAICMREFFDDSFRGLALEYKSKYDAYICDGLKAQIDAGQNLVFNFEAFRQPGASCDANPNACGANQECQFVDQGEVKGNFCITPCSAGALFDQLRKEIRRVNQISQFSYWDPNALYTDAKDARVTASQIAARKVLDEVREQTFLDVFDRMWSTVAMHEVGHNIGLRHNFASSTDALNFFEGYWGLKGSGTGADWKPTVLFDTDTESQTVNKMREYQQTSIMEYSSSFNARFQGLGAYDRAAILYGYGELVEVFDNPPAFSTWEKYLADPVDEDPTQFPIDSRRVAPLAKAFEKVHHTNYPAMFGGVDKLLARKVVDAYATADLTKACSQHDSPYDTSVCGGNGSFCQPYPKGFFCTKPNQIEVPFRFCSDEYNRSTPSCQTWDEGVDPFEIVHNSIADYDAYWPFWAYKRDNDLFNPGTSYWGRVSYELYSLRKQFEHWALSYARYNKGDWWEKRYGTPWHLDPNGGLGGTLAAKEIFEHFANIFGRPSDGYYGFNRQRGTYEPIVENGFNTYTNIFQIREDLGARPIYPSYDFSGYIYTPYRAGTFYDRLAALMFMSYPTTMFTVGVDKVYDTKRFRLNFASVWPQRVHNLFAGIIAGRPEMYGWCIEHNGEPPTSGGSGSPVGVKRRLWFGTEAELDAWYANCTPLDPEPLYDFPTTQYRLPAIAAVYGFGWMAGTYDRSFIDRNRIWLEGDGSDVSIPPGFTTVKYTDALSGKTYVAAYDPAEEDPTKALEVRDLVPADDLESQDITFWPAARIVVEAKNRLDRYLASNTPSAERSYKEIVGRLEILRGLYRYFDFGF
ncbi:MAG: zinc-dependent metalloprotease [Deltaproteobacteria bacterium]|nr:zinc-dependent metalloprotease [Deltaproteobacteria bacterium]